jgi:hypothetical protein
MGEARAGYELLTDSLHISYAPGSTIEGVQSEGLTWAVPLVLVAIALLTAPLSIAAAGSALLAAAWCIKIDREEYRVQLIDSDGPELNR